MDRLSDIDLNLLPILRALLEERSVTKAAKRVGLSQPATSNALNRLRELFDDPLLVRQGRQMVPTARALALAGPVGEALSVLAGSLDHESFDPHTTNVTWRVASTDLGEWRVINRFLARLPELAPHATLEVWPSGNDVPLDDLASGTIDLAFGVYLHLPSSLRWQDVATDQFVCVLREGHPAVEDGALSLERYLELSHVLVSPTGRTTTVVDFSLKNKGLDRRVAVVVPRYLEVPFLVATTDLCAILPQTVADVFVDLLPVMVVPPPMRLPKFRLRLVWHRRTDRDAGLRWLRNQLVAPEAP